MKKMIGMLMAIVLLLQLAACGPAETDASVQQPASTASASEPESTQPDQAADQTSASETPAFTFTQENFPVMDGSTSMVPLGQAIASVLLGIGEDEAADLISFNKTTQSLRNLMNGDCDLVIAAEPDSAVFDEMEQAGFAYESETIAREALVFVVNEDNPVDNLTSEQVRKIYSGEITNWSQVGGNDEEITAFQRNQGAGSQVMMEKLVMGDTPMAEAPEGYVVDAMNQLIDAVKSYDNTASAIGYTVYYYANDMKMADGLKILAIDGVQPGAETIRSGEYPYLNGYYSYLPASAAADSPARMLYNWLVSAQGQYLLNLEGYVSVMENPEEAQWTESNPVTANFSMFAAVQNGNLYTRLSEQPMDRLQASDGYGSIYPYAGAPMYNTWTDPDTGEEGEQISGWSYGFVTGDGTIITDPVYARADLLNYYNYTDYMSSSELPVWVYCTIGDVETVTDGSYSWAEGDLWYGFAALDGSFATDCVYEYVEGYDQYILATRDGEQHLFELYDLDGNLLFNSSDLDFYDRFPEGSCDITYNDGVFTIRLNDGYWFMSPAGELLQGPYNNLGILSCGWATTTVGEPEESYMENAYVNTAGEILEIPDTEYVGTFIQNHAVVKLNSGEDAVIDSEGNILMTTNTEYGFSNWSGGWCNYGEDGSQTYYDWEWNLLFGGPLDADTDPVTKEIVFVRTDNGGTIRNTQTGAELTLEGCSDVDELWWPSHSMLMAETAYDENIPRTYWMLDQDLNILYEGDHLPRTLSDPVTGQEYLCLVDQNYETCEIETLDQEPVLSLSDFCDYPEAVNGRILVTTASASELYSTDGTLIFRYCYFGGDD